MKPHTRSRHSSAQSLTRAETATALDPDDAASMIRYRWAANYLAAAQIYLCANPLLDEPLKREHIKDRLAGSLGRRRRKPISSSITC